MLSSSRKAWGGISAIALAGLFAATPSLAQMATTLEQAEMAGLSPQKRAEVEARMKQGGQTVYEILQTILLNSIKLKHPASRIVALDFNRGIAIVETAGGKIETVDFDTATLSVKG
jgi:hypothetical protein